MNQEINYQTVETKSEKPNYALRRIGIAVIAAALIFGTIKGVELAPAGLDYIMHPYKFSVETEKYQLQPGEGLNNAAEHVNGVGSVPLEAVRYYIEKMPENSETLANGLQEHEVVVIPETVTKR